MLFQTRIFMLFFVVVYAVYLAVRRTRFRIPWLLAASYFFYACWEPSYLVLLVWVTAIDYLAVLLMDRTRWRRLWLVLSIVNNLSLLGFFKYGEFAVESLNAVLVHVGVPVAIPPPGALLPEGLAYVLPVGISFYVFQSMSYTIDFYRGKVERETSFIRYAAFVSLFPRLAAGPIERARNLLPQLRRTPTLHLDDVTDGASLFVVGLFKKVALADGLALYVNKVYAAPQQFGAAALLLATVAFGWQIYFDFSGYTDMARGIARAMGLRLMLNFNNPYLATGLGDFWKRWHISLSTWFRDYVYIPLGGNRRGEARTYLNMAATMVISGLWHGAAWTFVLWGAVHAAGYALTRRLEANAFYRERVPAFVKRLWVFVFVTFAWIFFRADSFADAWTILSRICTAGWTDPAFPLLLLAVVAGVWLYQRLFESRLRRVLALAPVRIAMVIAMVIIVVLFAGGGGQEFIYFQF